MTARVTTNHVFVAFNQQVRVSRTWLSSRVHATCGYSRAVLVDRLTQKVVEAGLPVFAGAVHRRLEKGRSPLPDEGTTLDCGELRLEVGSGRITPAPRAVVRGLATFLLHWGYCLLAIVRGAFNRTGSPPAVLMHDLYESDLYQDGSDAAFAAFCREGPIPPLREAARLYVSSQGAPQSSEPERFVYCRHPLVALTVDARLGLVGRTALLLKHLALPLNFFRGVVRAPLLSLLGREIALTELARTLDRAGMISAVAHTCSSYRLQPIWARLLAPGRSHMIWYAQNWKPLMRLADDVESDYPPLLYIRADVHWVWTEAFATYLSSLVGSDVRAVGPILWRLPEAGQERRADVTILAFDVPAVTDEVMLNLNGEITNYFNPARLGGFVEGLVATRDALAEESALSVRLVLKMKRGFRPDYAKDYFDFVDASVAEGRLERADPEMNLFSLIAGSDLVIAYPFTSPAYVAEALGVPSIYFDPSGELAPDFFGDTESISFAGSRSELLSEILEVVNKSVRQT